MNDIEGTPPKLTLDQFDTSELEKFIRNCVDKHFADLHGKVTTGKEVDPTGPYRDLSSRESNSLKDCDIHRIFMDSFYEVSYQVFKESMRKGFWDMTRRPFDFYDLFELINEKVSKCSGWFYRYDIDSSIPRSHNIPNFSAIEETLADLVIMIMDVCMHRNLQLAPAIIAKMEYNKSCESKDRDIKS